MSVQRRSPFRTQIVPGAIEEKHANILFEYLRDNISWEDGVKSKKGFTRLAKSIDLDEYPEIAEIVTNILKSKATGPGSPKGYAIYGTYVNYYMNGEMWTPNHTHPGTHQLVLSLGETRTLLMGKKGFLMKSGDAILFGSSIHGVPKEPAVRGGRISIATFMKPVYD